MGYTKQHYAYCFLLAINYSQNKNNDKNLNWQK